MKTINRRQFLKNSSAAIAAMSLPAFWLPKSARAAGLGPKKLVLFFMNGGNDGMNTLVPTTTYQTNGSTVIPDSILNGTISQYNHYRNLRPTIHLKKTGDGPGPHLMPLGAIPGSGGTSSLPHRLDISSNASLAQVSAPGGSHPIGAVEFSFHPAFASLMPVWDAGQMAIFPATHCGPDASRSHFFQTEYIGHGLNTMLSSIYQHGDSKGWVGRYFEAKYGVASTNGIEGFDFESGYHPLMDGNIPVIGMSDPENASLGRDGISLRDNTLAINALREPTASTAYNAYAKVQGELFARVAKLDQVNYDDPGAPGGGDLYPDNSTGRDFRRAAALIKDPVIGLEIEVINIDRGGFDTHGEQVIGGNSAQGNHADRLKECADSIKAFYDDMQASGCADDVIVLVQTEFGRTVDENDNLGTDHARAACWLAVGGPNSINGGMYGAWPGIATDDIAGITDMDGSNRFYLHQTVDYRDILAEIIANHLDNSVNASAPFNPGGSSGYTRTNLGFI